MKRKMYSNGVLYPESCKETKKMIQGFNQKLDAALGENSLPKFIPQVVIVPHENYLYSGFTANFAYRVLAESSQDKKRIIVISASSKDSFSGLSGSFYKSYKTPCGKLKIDIDYLDFLRVNYGLGFHEKVHKEGRTEVQMPFIKYYLSHMKVVEILYYDSQQIELEKLLEELLLDSENIVVLCSDLGHLQKQKELGVMDATYLNAITMLDNTKLHEGCNASSLTAMKALIAVSKKVLLKPQILNYQTSSLETGSAISIQGHLSVAFYK